MSQSTDSTDPTDPEPWRDLRVGDPIRMTGIPVGWALPHAHVPSCTRKLVEKLVAGRTLLHVHHLDDLETPWILYESFDAEGRKQADFLSVHDLVWERVDEPA